jgi:hypothetical protein
MGTSNDGKEAKISQDEPEMLAIVADLMRSISVIQYYPQHETLEEVARDFNANWTTAVVMLMDDVYLGGENWNYLFAKAQSATMDNSKEAKKGQMRKRLKMLLPKSNYCPSFAHHCQSALRIAREVF